MRKMSKGNLKLDVVEHIILRNMWEYYILATEDEDSIPNADVRYALVMGDYDEIGTVSMSEIESHIFSRTTDLSEVMPAAGYQWVDECHSFLRKD